MSGGDDKLAFRWALNSVTVNKAPPVGKKNRDTYAHIFQTLNPASSAPIKAILAYNADNKYIPYAPYAHPVTKVNAFPDCITLAVASGGNISFFYLTDDLITAATDNPKVLPSTTFADGSEHTPDVTAFDHFTNWGSYGVGTSNGFSQICNEKNGNCVQIPSGFTSPNDFTDYLKTVVQLAAQRVRLQDSTGIRNLLYNLTMESTDLVDFLYKWPAPKLCQRLNDALKKLPTPAPTPKPPGAKPTTATTTCPPTLSAISTDFWAIVNYTIANNFAKYTRDWGHVHALVYFPVNFRFATGYGDGKIRYWSALDGRLLRTIDTGSNRKINALWALPTTLNLVSGGEDGTISIWHAPTGLRGNACRLRHL